MAIMPFKVIQGHQFWYQSKAHMQFPISDSVRTKRYRIAKCDANSFLLRLKMPIASHPCAIQNKPQIV